MSEKKYTLDETWTLCISMWRWIAKQRKAEDVRGIETLKSAWIKAKGFGCIESNCFFCHHAGACRNCPPRDLDPSFNCENPRYSFFWEPIKFYNKINYLNRKRLGKV